MHTLGAFLVEKTQISSEFHALTILSSTRRKLPGIILFDQQKAPRLEDYELIIHQFRLKFALSSTNKPFPLCSKRTIVEF
jgi:hypothetical protein